MGIRGSMMRLFITGATGLIGRRLVLDRLERGDQIVVLSRSATRAAALFAAEANPNVHVVQGHPGTPGSWRAAVEGCDAVVHLAGAGVADRRWSAAYKREIVNSRLDSTHQIVEAIAAAAVRPSVLINASAAGWYGDTGDRETDEQAEPATGDFLADLAVRWEREAMKAEEAGTRVVLLRTGIVLDERGGMLARLVKPFLLFAGGPFGSGRQYLPWIHWRDEIGLIDLALRRPQIRGPLNGAAPNPVTSRRFCRALGRALGRPSWLPVPTFAMRLVLGEVAKYAAMSQRLVPTRAMEFGYRFIYPEIEPALEALAARRKRKGGNTAVAAGAAIAAGSGAPAPLAQPTPTAARAGESGPMPPERPRLLAVGVDGTLLRSDGRLSKGVAHSCRAAQRAGCVVVPATARPPRSMRFLIDALGIVGPVINYNGAVIWNPLDDRPQFHESLDGALALEVIVAARQVAPNMLVTADVLDCWFTDRLDPTRLGPTAVPIEPDGVGPFEEFLTGPVTQVTLFPPPEESAAVRAVLEERFWRRGRIAIFQEAGLIRVAHQMVDKSIALQRIAARMGVPRTAVMAIGDGANDQGMVEWAGFGVAVANASSALTELADAVVADNDDQGVARAIHRYVLARSERTEAGTR
jgi:uncharacterized protein (TIGR01777 family)